MSLGSTVLTVRDGRTPWRCCRWLTRRWLPLLLSGLQRDEWIVKDEIQLAIRWSLHFERLLLLLLLMIQALILMIKLGPLRFRGLFSWGLRFWLWPRLWCWRIAEHGGYGMVGWHERCIVRSRCPLCVCKYCVSSIETKSNQMPSQTRIRTHKHRYG